MTNFVEDSDENRILSNLKTLMQPFDFDAQMVAPNKPLNYFEKINQIESIILQMYDMTNIMNVVKALGAGSTLTNTIHL